MDEGGGELITTDEAAIFAKPLLDPVVVKRRQSNRSLSDPARSNEGDWNERECEIEYPVNQIVAAEEGSRWRGWGFSWRAA